MNTTLDRVHIAGFRSLRDLTLDLTPVTVLIGPNGAGKSNLLSALEMIRAIASGSLQLFVGERGGATFLLHYGSKRTAAITIELTFSTENGHFAYRARLGYTANDGLIFSEERVGSRLPPEEWQWSDLGSGHSESRLQPVAHGGDIASTVHGLLTRIGFYHFHDTSRRSALRTRDFADLGSDWLRPDGSNLAAFLDGLRGSEERGDQAAWRLIEGTIRRIAPCVSRITPKRDAHGFRLEWVDDQGETFGPAHLSDGTLRAIALIAALGQPARWRPVVSCIDEPELGFHPAAIEILASFISHVGAFQQVIVSTQSPALIDCFRPSEVVVVERRDGASVFRRLDEAQLAVWLEDYTLSELYDKNLLGGRP
jgi:predicted ATPase